MSCFQRERWSDGTTSHSTKPASRQVAGYRCASFTLIIIVQLRIPTHLARAHGRDPQHKKTVRAVQSSSRYVFLWFVSDRKMAAVRQRFSKGEQQLDCLGRLKVVLRVEDEHKIVAELDIKARMLGEQTLYP